MTLEDIEQRVQRIRAEQDSPGNIWYVQAWALNSDVLEEIRDRAEESMASVASGGAPSPSLALEIYQLARAALSS